MRISEKNNIPSKIAVIISINASQSYKHHLNQKYIVNVDERF